MVEKDLLIIDIIMDTIKTSITQPSKGLNTDFSPQVQPDSTYRYALNAVNESELGDSLFISNEEGNEISTYIPEDFIIIGKRYIGDGNTVLFLVNKTQTISEIGLFNEEGSYITLVNDYNDLSKEVNELYSIQKLNFKISNPISCTYRLRRGFERTLYFTDGINPPRYYNIDKPNDFKKSFTIKNKSYNVFDASYFKLFRDYSKVPIFKQIVVKENGQLESGSYNIAIQYLDKDLNPTEWISVSETILIYKDSLGKEYYTIRGSSNDTNTYYSSGLTNKSISVTVDNLDEEFAGYRLALIEATNGSGIISKINVTDLINITQKTFTFTGNNTVSTVTEEEIKAPRNSISTALHIEQLENRLLIANTKGKSIRWGLLQKYASKIKTDLVLKKVRLDKLGNSNPKNPTLNFEGVGYMPGEVYSLGIVWVFEDGDTTPVYHIPGKSSLEEEVPYIEGLYSMKNNDNTCENSFYNTLNNNDTDDYWGLDANGKKLLGTNIRHHRFPLRSEINIPLIEQSSTEGVTANIFGLHFSNIEFPNTNDTGGYKIVGYFIVRNQRTKDNRTILDNGILTPLINHRKNPNNPQDLTSDYTSYGLTCPYYSDTSYTKIKKDVVGLINPEFLFNNEEFKDFDIIKEGYYSRTKPNMINFNNMKSYITKDVQNGTSYNAEINSGEPDLNGFSLNSLIRNNNLTYNKTTKSIIAENAEIKETFYLKALSYKNITDTDNKEIPIYNVSCDNNIGIININKKFSNIKDIAENLPYVVLKRKLSDFYSTFRVLPYYKETDLQTDTSCSVFNGDSYISPMKYVNTMFYDTALKERDTKDGWWKIALGFLLVAAGAVVTFSTGVMGVGLGLLVAGQGISLIKTGIEAEIIGSTYEKSYDKGLKFTVEDDAITKEEFFGIHTEDDHTELEDDEIRWFSEVLSDLWVESSVNISLRNGLNDSFTDFMNPDEFVTMDKISQYILNKLTIVDTDHEDGRLYRGFALPEIYEINKDYLRRNKEKVYFSLSLEYDFKNINSESFPHRIHYSEQSFQEELTDNYKVFLPNNYRDINGETGEITNIFKIQNNLFIHTKEALWQLPKNYQERITNQIVSFIGTGDYFSVPPQKIVDDESGNSAGNIHKWGTKKTQHGYFFVCEKQNCIYLFNGQQLKPITDNGIKNLIYYKIPISLNETLLPGQRYNNDDNPFNPLGTGFICTYDSKKERVIFTKKDFLFIDDIVKSKDYHIIYNNGFALVFENYNAKIKEMEILGFYYEGVIDNKMVFYNPLKNEEQVFNGVNIQNYKKYDRSWTLSYSLNTNTWISWHSYLPNLYIETSQNFFSVIAEKSEIWRHNVFGKYQTYYNRLYPFVIEYVSKSDNSLDKIWENISLITEAKKYDFINKEFIDLNNIFFNKAVFYNSRQCSGQLNILTKTQDKDYIRNQIENISLQDILAERREKIWNINSLYDFRINYNKPIFKSDDDSLKNEYPCDKVINTSTISFQKDWSELESFRDKYLVVRFIFDIFADIKMIVNYSFENQLQSFK
jgi:hypothetical protein